MRRVLVGAAVLALALGALTGCSGSGKPHSGAAEVPTREPQPPAVAGGSCQLLDYDEIAKDLGLTFDVAAASQVEQTYTCVLEREGAPLPDLTFSIALVSKLDIPTFKSKIIPSGAAVIGDLGKIGYSRTVPAGNGAGPTIEIGWLAGNQRLIILKCRLAADAPAGDAPAMVPKLLVLARRIDLTSI